MDERPTEGFDDRPHRLHGWLVAGGQGAANAAVMSKVGLSPGASDGLTLGYRMRSVVQVREKFDTTYDSAQPVFKDW